MCPWTLNLFFSSFFVSAKWYLLLCYFCFPILGELRELYAKKSCVTGKLANLFPKLDISWFCFHKCQFLGHTNGVQGLPLEFEFVIVNNWRSNKKSRMAIFPCVMFIVLGFLLKHEESVFPVIPEICVKYMRSTASGSLTKYPVHNLSSLGV